MIPVPSGVKVWLATGHTDMRKGFPGLSLMVQETLKRDPMCGHLFVFRGRGGGLIKVIWHDGQGACLFTKKLELLRMSEMWRSNMEQAGEVGKMWFNSMMPFLTTRAADNLFAVAPGGEISEAIKRMAEAPRLADM
ncbi:IS66 family insertion sequence element accessory protein TnpB (plasmid) [Rhizobium ruizarguesonis]|uniref:IS66 family insertion sequence element accessory protein TnpB n=1 Tax=Rhizobium ruizarguesonis TaxID=2081791 RepID=A0ACD5EFA0_9HYPH|nr:IS66 family insertion sequence element accessory protein TnpB [Rhizobium leguminosarum]